MSRGHDPGFFALDRMKLRDAYRALGGDLVGVLVLLCQETQLTANHRDLADEWGVGAKWLAVRLGQLAEAGAVTWQRPSNQYAEGSLVIHRWLGREVQEVEA